MIVSIGKNEEIRFEQVKPSVRSHVEAKSGGNLDPQTSDPELGLSPRSVCRAQSNSPLGAPRAAQPSGRAHTHTHTHKPGDREGETPAASGGPRLTPVTGFPGLPNRSRPVPSTPGPVASALGRTAGGRDPRAARLTGPESSRAGAARGSVWLGRSYPHPRPQGPPRQGSRPRERGERAPPASLTRAAAVGAHVAAPEPLRHGSRFTCREPRDCRGGGCASALTGPRAALKAPLPSAPSSPGTLRTRGETSC